MSHYKPSPEYNDSGGEWVEENRLGEDASLELKDLRDKGLQVNDPHRNSMADELAAMANTTNGVFVLGVEEVPIILSESEKISGQPPDDHICDTAALRWEKANLI